MVKYYCFFWLSSMFMTCLNDDKLKLDLRENFTGKLKLDGVYIGKDTSEHVDLYFLYNNGIILSRGSVKEDELEQKLSAIKNDTSQKYKLIKFLWGAYHIEENKIRFERWCPSEIPYRCLLSEGKILNDTTFIINHCQSSNGKYQYDEHEIYRFKKFSFKPDSSNIFIKP